MAHALMKEIMKLSVEEREELLDEIEESIDHESSDADNPVTPEQLAEIDNRLADLEKHPEDGEPWEKVVAELTAKYKK